jgi:hypothetical protein
MFITVLAKKEGNILPESIHFYVMCSSLDVECRTFCAFPRLLHMLVAFIEGCSFINQNTMK